MAAAAAAAARIGRGVRNAALMMLLNYARGSRRWPALLCRRRGFTTATTEAATDGPTLETIDRTHMARALALAGRCAVTGDVPVGALVACDRTGAILGESWNQRESLQSPCAHAETLALDAAALSRGTWRLDGTTLYVTLEPCIMCYGAVVLGRCDRIVYGAPNPTSGALTSGVLADHHKLNHRPVVVGGLMAQECGSLVRGFFQSMREVKKGGDE